MDDNYSQLISRIAEVAGVDISEIERRIEGKRAKLSGLVSKEGAAQIVAAELGINFDQERLKISQIVHGMRKVNVIGKILEIFPIREYNKNGREGKVCNLRVADDSANTKVVLWDLHHISLIEGEKLKVGDVVEISNGGARNGEIHLGGFSDIKKSKEELKDVVVEIRFGERKLKDVKPGDRFKTRAVIVQIFEPRYFEVCPECGKRVVDGKCVAHGEIVAKKRVLLSVVLDDGSETLRSVLFSDQIKKLGLTDDEIFSLELFSVKKGVLLGEEKFFSGSMRQNQLYNTTEMTIEDVGEIDPQMLIKELESKS